jgi:soluble lytic murein transglycosylase-like protein
MPKIRLTILADVILLFFSLSFLFYSGYSLNKVLPVAIDIIPKKDLVLDESRRVLSVLNAPVDKKEELAHAVSTASKLTDLSPSLIASLMYTESEFKYTAVSKKGYKGLMQTPWATLEYADVDILYGCRILKQKLRAADNDLLHALALYKGGDNSEAKKYAKQTFVLYQKVKKTINL